MSIINDLIKPDHLLLQRIESIRQRRRDHQEDVKYTAEEYLTSNHPNAKITDIINDYVFIQLNDSDTKKRKRNEMSTSGLDTCDNLPDLIRSETSVNTVSMEM